MPKSKKILIFVLLAIIIVLGVVLGAKIISGEDNWICSDGKWVKHGNPLAEMPRGECE